ncbi:MAG: hypothetical protein EBT22_12295, partial [Chloroflexi bacterium]|nr:hypothetical protein [Chloroflexota bacterium]
MPVPAGAYWPGTGSGRGGTGGPGERSGRELSPGQFADWHEFVGHVRSVYSRDLRQTVERVFPGVPCAIVESGWAGLPGVGVATPPLNSDDTSAVGRLDDDHPPMISLVDRSGTCEGRVASLVVAVGEGMVSLTIPEAWMADPEVRSFIAFVAAHSDELVASTHLTDPVVWIDDAAYAGADPDDIATVGASATSLRWREERV